MVTFYLLRHGEKETVMGDPPLSELGRKQAELTGQFLKNFSISAIFSSPLLRTKQTAEIIGSQLHVPIQVDKRLLERMNWGDKENETFEEFLQEWRKASKDRLYKPVHGDSAWGTGKRMEDFILDKKDLEHVLVVTHEGTINDFIQNIFPKTGDINLITGASYVELPECSITTIVYYNGTFLLQKLGDLSHLSGPLI